MSIRFLRRVLQRRHLSPTSWLWGASLLPAPLSRVSLAHLIFPLLLHLPTSSHFGGLEEWPLYCVQDFYWRPRYRCASSLSVLALQLCFLCCVVPSYCRRLFHFRDARMWRTVGLRIGTFLKNVHLGLGTCFHCHDFSYKQFQLILTAVVQGQHCDFCFIVEDLEAPLKCSQTFFHSSSTYWAATMCPSPM